MDKKEQEEKKKEQSKKISAEINKLFLELSIYPVALTDKKLNSIFNKLERYYKKGHKFQILFHLHNILSSVKNFRIIKDREYVVKTLGVKDPREANNIIYKSFFSSFQSLEGLLIAIEFIKRLDSVESIKLITYHLNYYLSVENDATKILKNACFSVLAESKQEYALDYLLRLAKYSKGAKINEDLFFALKQWSNKRLKKDKKEQLKRFLEELKLEKNHYL